MKRLGLIILLLAPLGTANGNHREVCIDEMRFNPDGTIAPVKITFEGVKTRPVAAGK